MTDLSPARYGVNYFPVGRRDYNGNALWCTWCSRDMPSDPRHFDDAGLHYSLDPGGEHYRSRPINQVLEVDGIVYRYRPENRYSAAPLFTLKHPGNENLSEAASRQYLSNPPSEEELDQWVKYESIDRVPSDCSCCRD